MVSLLASSILWYGKKRTERDIKNPQNTILLLNVILVATILQLLLLYYIKNLFFWYLSYLTFQTVAVLVSSISLVVCAQQISKHCQEGYEGFSINLISGCTNIAIILGNYLGQNVLGSYLGSSHYHQKSITYTVILNIELAVIPLLLAVYFFKLRN